MDSSSQSLGRSFSFIKAFTRGEFFYSFWDMVSKSVAFLNTVLVISALSLYQYGVFQLLLSSYSALSIFIGLGDDTVRNDIFRYIGERKFSHAKRLLFQSLYVRLAIGIFFFLLVFFGAPFFSFRFGEEFIALIQISSLLFLHDSLLTSVRLFLESKRQFSLIASRASLTKFSQAAILLGCFFLYKLGLTEVVLSLVIAQFVSLLFLTRPFLKALSAWKDVEASKENLIVNVFLSYGKWEMVIPPISRATNFLQNWTIKLFVSTEAVAIFSVAQSMLGVFVGLFPIKTLSTLVPMRMGNEAQMKKIYSFSTKYLFFLAILIGCGAAIVSPIAIHLFFPKYVVSLPYFYFLLLTIPVSAMSSITSILLVVFRQQKALFLQKILKGITVLPMIPFLMFFGLWGLVAYRLIFSQVLFLAAYYQLRRAEPSFRLHLHDFLSFSDEDKNLAREVSLHVRNLFTKRLRSFFA